ncbi:GxxExxY protein [Pontibacter akesuensis]|uniref:GxxExxY protein n=2 Tax=Pontibacter akesuensis TaxID=388950 RepID=A0A1I7K7Q8_9BACT|nr:GxxExxY protein [Pontibacter akesuensis]
MELDEVTYKVIGCAMKVHNTLGSGFQEVIYQRCLAIELQQAGLNFEREKEQVIFYSGMEVGSRRADFIIENSIVVELKALVNLEDIHLAQAKTILSPTTFRLACSSTSVPSASNTKRCLTTATNQYHNLKTLNSTIS